MLGAACLVGRLHLKLPNNPPYTSVPERWKLGVRWPVKGRQRMLQRRVWKGVPLALTLAATALLAEPHVPETGMIFKERLPGAEPRAEFDPVDCIPSREIKNMEVINDSVVVLHGSHDRFWVNKLRHKCHGLRSDMALRVIPWAGRFCANDRFEARERFQDGPYTISCRWGEFEPAAIDQVALIKAELGEDD